MEQKKLSNLSSAEWLKLGFKNSKTEAYWGICYNRSFGNGKTIVVTKLNELIVVQPRKSRKIFLDKDVEFLNCLIANNDSTPDK